MEPGTQTLTLRQIRKRTGYGLETFARKAGITVNMLLRYEFGRQEPTLKNAAKMAMTLGCKLEDISEFQPMLRELKDLGIEVRLNGHRETS